MNKRAAIYIRVSTERQAEKISPEAQEKDCRDYCHSRGYQVVGAYRDIERYRSGSRMVEPSGTRSDRPQFLRMLADIDAGKVDLVIAWREDRLYRNVNKAMLEISERVTKNIIAVELVKEHYDASTAVVKAWAAGIELKAKHDRTTMGVSGRLQRGKEWLPHVPYGYQRINGGIAINEVEAHWVRQIWKWYGEGQTLADIRRFLINGGAPQRGKNRYSWSIPQIRHILKFKKFYTGIAVTEWDGTIYETKIPVIVDSKTAQKVKNRRGDYKRYPAGNRKTKTLAGGLIYCKHCNKRMKVIFKTAGNKRYNYYACPTNREMGSYPDGCARSIHIEQADEEIWERVWRLFEYPEEFNRAIQKRIAELQSKEMDAEAESSDIERQLEELEYERQKVITWARKKIITEDDLEIQMAVLDQQKSTLMADLNNARLMLGGQAEKLLELANLYTAQVKAGMEELNRIPKTEAQQKRQMEFRRRIIANIVSRVDVNADKSIKVYTEWKLPQLCSEYSGIFADQEHVST